MFCDHYVNILNKTGNDMMCSSGILITSMPIDWGSDVFGQRLDTNAAVLPNSPNWIIAQRLDSKASKSGWPLLLYVKYLGFQIQS